MRPGFLLLGKIIVGAIGVLFLIAANLPAQTTTSAAPSSHCHVTDGTFSTCPDGTNEWSDVPFKAFPETNSFLYADQANLDPTLASPNNTFVLMYDQCSRTTPLGPNEYVLVSLKTVELESGLEKLKNYSLHLFTNGTIVFVENGAVQLPGRAQIIEGMRGAVGFGPSPNCSFNHVAAEFQIELSAAGGHSYSPDPLFWSSFIPPPPPPPPPAMFRLNVTTAGSAIGPVQSSDGAINCSSIGAASCFHDYHAGDTVTLQATSVSPGFFVEWQETPQGISCSGSGACVVIMNSDQSVDAVFTQLCPSAGGIPVQLPDVTHPILLPPKTGFELLFTRPPFNFDIAGRAPDSQCSLQSSPQANGDPNLPSGLIELQQLLTHLPLRQIGEVTVQPVRLDYFVARSVIDTLISPTSICSQLLGIITDCYLSQLPQPGDIVVRWHTANFQTNVRLLPPHDSGPRTFWVTLNNLITPKGLLLKSDNFATVLDKFEAYIHRILLDGFSESLFPLAIFAEPPGDILVTDASGRKTGRLPSGTVAEEIPGSAYLPSSNNAVAIYSPDAGQYRVDLLGAPSDIFSLAVSVSNFIGNFQAPTVIQNNFTSTIGPTGVTTINYQLTIPPPPPPPLIQPQWTQLFPIGGPGPRAIQAAVYVPGTNQMIVFAGETVNSANFNDVWKLTNANGVGVPAWSQVTPAGSHLRQGSALPQFTMLAQTA